MRRSFLSIVLILINFTSFSETIAWKGKEFGLEENPIWLEKYLKNKDESFLRKKFGIKINESVIVASGTGKELVEARAYSQMNAYKIYFSSNNRKTSRISFIYEFWKEDSDAYFTVYSIYVL